MDLKKALLFIGIPLAGAAILAAALAHRSGPAVVFPARPAASKAVGPIYAPATLAEAPKPAPPEKIAQATDAVKIRGTYQNFRHAVAARDAGLQDQLLPALLKDRATARRFADEDLARAQTDLDRDLARKVLEALRR